MRRYIAPTDASVGAPPIDTRVDGRTIVRRRPPLDDGDPNEVTETID
ncbi:hypothetical protein ACNS7O_09210 [Haloferacaceae archaeon DSL9]